MTVEQHIRSPDSGPISFETTQTSATSNGDDVHDSPDNIPDEINNIKPYESRKKAVYFLVDVALLTANASQLRALVNAGATYKHYSLLLAMVVTCIISQILVSCIMIVIAWWTSKANSTSKTSLKYRRRMNILDVLDFISMFLILVVVCLNILITAFGLPTFTNENNDSPANINLTG